MKKLIPLLLFLALPLAAQTTIAANNAALLAGLSPYNWQTNGATSVKTVNIGAYLTLNFTGTSVGITVDTTALVSNGYDSKIYPVMRWTIDGTIRGSRQLLSSDTGVVSLASGLADTTHTLRLEVIGIDQDGTADRWTSGHVGFVLTSLRLDTSRTVTQSRRAPGGNMIIFGDSISEGAVVLAAKTGANSYAQIADGSLGYQHRLAVLNDMEHGNCSFAGGGWTNGVGNYPGLATGYASIFNGVTRVFSPAPDIAIVNMGTNGTVVAGTITTFLTNLRAAVGPTCRIHVMIPFGQLQVSAITNGFNTYRTNVPADLNVVLIDLGSAGSTIVSGNSFDTVHPNTLGQDMLYVATAPFVRRATTAGQAGNFLASN